MISRNRLMRAKYEYLVRFATWLGLTTTKGRPHGLLAEDILRAIRTLDRVPVMHTILDDER